MASIFPSEDSMRKEFWRLKAEVEAMEAEIAPLRAEYDKINQDFHKKIEPIRKKLKTAEAPLFDLKNQMGMIVRALGGRTGG